VHPLSPDTFASGLNWLSEGAKLLGAAAIGVCVVASQRLNPAATPTSRSMEQAHVLLCVAGALTMLIVGDSLARAFGIAGAAAIIRFRTPVDDPRDITVLFLLMGLGMATGLGLVGVAVVGTLFVCGCLLVLRRSGPAAPRSMKIAVTAEGHEFPAGHVSRVFAAHGIAAEPLEFSNWDHASVRYRALVSPDTCLDEVSALLLDGSTGGIRSVAWQPSKKRRGKKEARA
jgi:hypothetical protein